MTGASADIHGRGGRREAGGLRAREGEPQRGGRRRLLESTALALAGALLLIATVNDVVLQTHVNHRLVADLRTWRLYTAHNYHTLSVSQDVRGHTTRDVVCGNTSPGGPRQRVQLCLEMTGPVTGGRRAVHGGWYLPPEAEDLRAYRYACFGSASRTGRCPR
jgi:hypothetical protein